METKSPSHSRFVGRHRSIRWCFHRRRRPQICSSHLLRFLPSHLVTPPTTTNYTLSSSSVPHSAQDEPRIPLTTLPSGVCRPWERVLHPARGWNFQNHDGGRGDLEIFPYWGFGGLGGCIHHLTVQQSCTHTDVHISAARRGGGVSDGDEESEGSPWLRI